MTPRNLANSPRKIPDFTPPLRLVSRLKSLILVPLLLAVWVLNSAAQVLPESLPKHPADGKPSVGILDSNGFWDRDPEAAKRISERIQKLNHDHGYRIHLVIESVLLGTNAHELANDLRRKWLPEGDGLVIVFEADSRNLGIGQDMVGDPNQTENLSRIPAYETTAIATRAIASVDPKLAPPAYVEAISIALITELETYFARRAAPPPKERSVRTALVVVGGLALLGLGIIGAASFIRFSSMAKVNSYRFPTVDRPERLGAPCGSSVTTRRFAPAVKS